jgi:hypothetical protein
VIWHRNLYFGKKAEKKADELIQKIESGKTPVNTYLVTLPTGEHNQLEIIPVWDTRFWYQGKECPTVVGLAQGRIEALILIREIAEDVCKKTGSADLRGYFEKG